VNQRSGSPNAGPALKLRWRIYDAEILERKGDWAGAVRAYEAAMALQAALATVQSSRALIERTLRPSHDLPSRLAYARTQTSDLWGAVAALENGRARLLTSKLARAAYRAAFIGDVGRPQLAETYESVLRQVEEFELIRDSGRVDAPEGTVIQRPSLSASLERMASEVRRLPGFEHFGLPQSAVSVPGLLASHNVLYLFSTEYGGQALLHVDEHRGGLMEVPLPDAASRQLIAKAESLVEALTQLDVDFPSAVAQIDDVCGWLGSAVIAPLLPVLERHAATSVTIVPCTWFSILPIHAAWTVHPNRPSVRRYPLMDLGVAYIPNTQVLQALTSLPESKLSQDVLVVAEQPSPNADLPGSVGEATAVQGLWPSSHLAWRKDDVLAAVPTCTLAHFATHAISRPGQPLKSGILVADDIWVEVHELMSVQFRAAPLCVLSACHTAAVGHSVPDEGTGLVSGLLSAGAKGVIASMWPVDDFATQALMTILHHRLRESTDGRAALRDAQMKMRDITIEELRELHLLTVDDDDDFDEPPGSHPFAHPFFWAGFCYTGV
jgi:CHAT domain